MSRKTYITTSIPYVNAEPHVGFALELVQADVIARFNRLIGREVHFQTGTDENAIKNTLAAAQQGLTTGELVDRNSQRYRELLAELNISSDDFIRTTEKRHRKAVHAFWQGLRSSDIYRKTYQGLYCTNCEDFYNQKELLNGCCPEHGTKAVDIHEENYFFRLSAYQQQIESLLANSKVQVVPETRLNEVLSFVRTGLQDFSISRASNRTGGWGISVPGDNSQVIYVWIDALINYLSGLGFGAGTDWRQWWNDDVEKVHVIGKNVWKFHAVYWLGLLLSARLPLPDRIVVHGFLTANGRKIGKSLGNAIDPFECVKCFGTDAVRYYLLRAIPPFGDGDFSLQRLKQLYNTDLANDLGNLVSRLTALCERANFGRYQGPSVPQPPKDYRAALEQYEFDKATAVLWGVITNLNRGIEDVKPWELLKANDSTTLTGHLSRWICELYRLAYWLGPLLPATSAKIIEIVSQPQVKPEEQLFPRKE